MINEDALRIGKSKSGDEIWICGHCQQPADHGHGAQNRDEAAYLLMCPAGEITLGEWGDPETKNTELRAYKQSLIRPE